MSLNVQDRATRLDTDVLSAVVRRVLNDESATPLAGWNVNPIGGSVGTGTLGIFHIVGRANSSSGISDWSVVAKVMDLEAVSELDLTIETNFSFRMGGSAK